MSIANPNTTDATMGQTLRFRVETRMAELTAALATPMSDMIRSDVRIALGEIGGLMTGDLDHIPHVVAAELNRWLEAKKHLVEYHTHEQMTDERAMDEATD